MKKRIAIDCHTLEIDSWAGKEQYLASILENLHNFDSENEYTLYFRVKVFEDSEFPKWKIKNINLPTPIWQIYVLFHSLFARVSLFLIPCSFLLSFLNFFIPQIVVIHDLTTFLPDINKNHKKMTVFKEKLLLKRSLKNSKKIIAVSENTKKDLIKIFNVKPKKIQVIYEAADDRFKHLEDRESARKEASKYVAEDEFILSIGTLEPRKNYLGLIEAFSSLKNDIDKKIKLVIVGKKGWYYEDIFNKVKDLNLEQDVIFTGYIPDQEIPALLNTAICMVYPSFYEGFGLPVLEAMSCGCPVITSNISSIPEITEDKAILINPADVDEISRALRLVILSKEKKDELSKDGLERSKFFSWEKTSLEMINLFKTL